MALSESRPLVALTNSKELELGTNPRLADVTAAWERLPEHIRAAIHTLAKGG